MGIFTRVVVGVSGALAAAAISALVVGAASNDEPSPVEGVEADQVGSDHPGSQAEPEGGGRLDASLRDDGFRMEFESREAGARGGARFDMTDEGFRFEMDSHDGQHQGRTVWGFDEDGPTFRLESEPAR